VSTLYLVATPIGNLEDISTRALRVLSEVRLIAAEDTRHSKKLLNHFNIPTPITSYHEHNKDHKAARLLDKLEKGDVALVSDAGTPALNDPGYELVRAALDAGHQVSPIPGPCAPVAALVVSGLPTDAFLYLGYLPRKSSSRRRLLTDIAGSPYTLVFLETPHRLLSALDDMGAVLGDRQIAVARELTKLHEEIFRGSLNQASTHFTQHPPRGEITLVLEGSLSREDPWSEEQLREALVEAQKSNEPASQIARQIAALAGWSKRDVYDLLVEVESQESTDKS
jgi:16S rRNA (cytidine1402-2'-O)-methyltransferase